jgi:hypothetical protein
VKRDTTKLGGESRLEPMKKNLLMSEHIRSWMTPARSNNPDELPNLNDSIRRKLVQLNPELA